MTAAPGNSSILRERDGHEARVSYAELFFDLVYVFAVTQLSHSLLHHLSWGGALETLILWFAVWLVWQYTCWFTNWFDPEKTPIRLCLFVLMAVGLVMAAAIPEAFKERGLIFACCIAAMQVGRSAFALAQLGRGSPLTANFQRLLIWSVIAGCFWIAGGLAEGPLRIVLWVIAVGCEYFAPMFGLWLPILGRSHSGSEWTIEGGHLVERCALFVIVALGESILVTGATLSESEAWELPALIAFLVAFVGSIAMWWVYFDTSTRDATEVIVESDNPGQLGAYIHYLHVLLVAGVIVAAVGNDLSIKHPDQPVDIASLAVIYGGPAIYLVGNAIYKRLIYGRVPISHIAGLLALALAAPFSLSTDLLMISGITTVIVLAVAVWEGFVSRKSRAPAERHAS
ncbi:membrane protein [Labrys miyagiensis]|uniref:Membrane protein n=1 Tax=Labrys miyagiensis TaxID=346912 RepID=A0ABQ6CSC9_9HYPH|nr:low temperature requirement protein A [Labrys miyagiensis]GLS22688.1 membrane protein [Labrys miyagiensis]